MATTRLIALHVNKGKTIAQSLGDRTDYAKNPEKTDKSELVTGYECDPLTVDEEFMLLKRQYEQITGRHQQHEVIAYQIRQSFQPGEITPEEANRVGRGWRSDLPRASMHSSWRLTRIGLTFITTSSSIPLPWMARGNSKTSGSPDWLSSAAVI